jgi:hypothetical protein
MDKLGLDRATAVQTYDGCLLFHAGCTADGMCKRTCSRMG